MFLMFGFNEYYPGGGINDLLCQAENLEELNKIMETSKDIKNQLKNNDFIEIYNTETKELFSRHKDGKLIPINYYKYEY